jgi:hypothetical protein
VDKELRKHCGQPNMLGDGHNNTATAAEALSVTSNHGVPLTYTQRRPIPRSDCPSCPIIRKPKQNWKRWSSPP